MVSGQLNIRAGQVSQKLASRSEFPFTSTGFTSGNNGRLGVPEWNLPERIKFTDGDEIWEVFNDGTQRLRGVYKEDLGKFISK